MYLNFYEKRFFVTLKAKYLNDPKHVKKWHIFTALVETIWSLFWECLNFCHLVKISSFCPEISDLKTRIWQNLLKKYPGWYRYQVPIPGIGICMEKIGMNPASVGYRGYGGYRYRYIGFIYHISVSKSVWTRYRYHTNISGTVRYGGYQYRFEYSPNRYRYIGIGKTRISYVVKRVSNKLFDCLTPEVPLLVLVLKLWKSVSWLSYVAQKCFCIQGNYGYQFLKEYGLGGWLMHPFAFFLHTLYNI